MNQQPHIKKGIFRKISQPPEINARRFLAFIVPLISLLFVTSCGGSVARDGSENLRGQWLFSLNFESGETIPQLQLYINDIIPGSDADTYLGTGCMRSPEMEASYPLEITAEYQPSFETYNFSLYTSFIPAGETSPLDSMKIINFRGSIEFGGSGVSDDLAYGVFQTSDEEGNWQATHHDRRKFKCPAVSTGGERLNMDVSAHLDLGRGNQHFRLEANHILIVASALQVTAPNGEEFVVPPQASIWAPGVDFVNEFRFELDGLPGWPIPGKPYKFVLLDLLGEPIRGTETEDTWTHCNQVAPSQLQIFPNPATGQEVILSWVGVPTVPFEFEPGVTGYYQFGLDPEDWAGSVFGADSMALLEHVIPWASFIPDAAGNPDGRNVGVSLGEFLDGNYLLQLMVMYEANPANGGYGGECGVEDSSQALRMVKEGDLLTFSPYTLGE